MFCNQLSNHLRIGASDGSELRKYFLSRIAENRHPELLAQCAELAIEQSEPFRPRYTFGPRLLQYENVWRMLAQQTCHLIHDKPVRMGAPNLEYAPIIRRECSFKQYKC